MLDVKSLRVKDRMLILLLAIMLISSIAMTSLVTSVSIRGNYGQVPEEEIRSIYEKVVKSIDYDRVAEHLSVIEKAGSRIPGQPGLREVAEYIAEKFEEYGLITPKEFGFKSERLLERLDGYFQKYKVVAPVEEECYIEVISPVRMRLKAYSMWPNSIQTSPTPPEGLRGTLVYADDGDLEDFNGKRIEGAIVMLRYDCGRKWLNAFKLGAKAVIFMETPHATRLDSLAKILITPLYTPRVYVTSDVGAQLLKLLKEHGKVEVRVVSRVFYREVEAYNVIGLIKGTETPDEIIIISAHYDSWSPVLAFSRGVDEATSIAVLLELARYFSENPPPRSLMFVAFSGHWEALAGPREFVEYVLFDDLIQKENYKVWTQINLDFSTDSDELDILHAGCFYRYAIHWEGQYVVTRWEPLRRLYSRWIYAVEQVAKSLYGVSIIMGTKDFITQYGWWGRSPSPYMIDSEPLAVAGLPSITLRTAHAYRVHWNTPLDDRAYVNMENLKKLVIQALPVLCCVIYEPKLGLDWSLIKPRRFQWFQVGSYQVWSAGFVTLKGIVWTYNISKGWFSKIPRALVRVWLASTYPFSQIIVYADENGDFIVHGLCPTPSIDAGWAPVLPAEVPRGIGWYVDAWVVDENTGEIIYAPDYGQYGIKFVNFKLWLLGGTAEAATVVMPACTITLYDVIDPKLMRRIYIPDPRLNAEEFLLESFIITPYDFESRSIYIWYGTMYSQNEEVAMVFLLPRTRSFVVMSAGPGLPRTVAFVVNASDEYPEGSGIELGYKIRSYSIPFTAYRYAYDMYTVARHRYNTLASKLVRSLSAEEVLKEAKRHLELAEEYYRNMEYDKAYREAYLAWTWSVRAYEEVMSLINDTANTTIAFFALMIPFVFFFERLLFHSEGRRRLLVTIALSIVLVFIFYNMHPGLSIISNAFMGFMGILLEVFFIITLAILFDEVNRIMKEVALKLKGLHKPETGTVGIMMLAFSVAVENMRKRKLRTTLVLATIIAIAIGLTSITSASYYTTVKRVAVPKAAAPPEEAVYAGVFLKRQYCVPYDIFDHHLIEYAEGLAGDYAIVCPRVWYYPETELPSEGPKAILRHGENIYAVRALLGMRAEEVKIIFKDVLIGEGFREDDYYACILEKYVAEKLNVTIGDVIEWAGIKLKVMGIFDGSILGSVVDLDNRAITPVDPITVQPLCRFVAPPQVPAPTTLSWSSVLIVPWRLALDLGGYVANVAIRLKPEVIEANRDLAKEVLHKMAWDAAMCLDVEVFMGWEGVVHKLSRITVFLLLGWNLVSVILAIGIANIVVTMLGAVKERVREIFTYSSLGLSPIGVASMFVSETLVYAILGALVGYIIGFYTNLVFISTGLLPGYFVLNYSSLFVLVAIACIILATLTSAAYPASIAAKMVTPSLERRWKPPTKPRGDEWDIPLPLRVPSRKEALGVIEYLREYFEGEGRETRTFMVRELKGIQYDKNALLLIVGLAPYEMQVNQEVAISASLLPEEKRYAFSLHLRRISGARSIWVSSNYYFIDSIRKQLLLWRSLPSKEQAKYIERAEKALHS
ncbi:MAG: hypothetical protein DRN15_02045 [Thermoprotei archaeon]|nr:MAG: hypothetical protein DRM97_04400 [Thermoprotei archaeon]RLF24740.1 MAG: hypothetical protein DRN15_02045 [Thermoprotei archaeon]